jgi:tetratricopeptide (TPR) repeat protein
MKNYFASTLVGIQECDSDVECRVRIISSIRLLLQQVTYGLLEWISQQSPSSDLQPDQNIIQGLRSPADGALVDGFEALLITCEKMGWSGVSRILVVPIEQRPANLLCNAYPKNLQGLLRAVVSLRNDGAEGHGLVGGYQREAEIDALKFLLEYLLPVLPVIETDGKATIGDDRLARKLDFIRGWNETPALIRRIKILSSDVVRAYCQVDTGSNSRKEFAYEAVNPFRNLAGRGTPSLSIWENSWEPLCYLPERTTDSFTGRSEQLDELKEWAIDEESRSCLVYGDGGYGKTTLVLEFLHRVLEEEQEMEWKPTLILFYTAKRWQWGINGLEPISAGQPHLMELLAFIHLLFFGEYPGSDFYRLEVVQAASKLQGRIKNELKVERKDILIVIDNAETLIESDEERTRFGKELKEVSRRVGRVILTSRRYEQLGADPIGIDALSEQEAVEFLRDRALKLNIHLVRRAKDEEILSALNKLERRPIVLNAFANALSDPAVKKIDQAADRVAGMLRKDLGTFLFADTWARLGPGVRRLLLLMTRIGDSHESQSLRICADIVGVSVQAAELALQETGGIASQINVQGDLQLTFSNNFLEYAKEKNVKLADGTVSPSDVEINKARTQYSAYLKGTRSYTGDRIAAAFRTPQAKAAHRARHEGDFDESKRLFELAIMVDRDNGWLWDRYAYFLFHDIRDNEDALHKSVMAVELLPMEGEVWLTRGLIEARLGHVRECEKSLERAEAQGIAWQRCAIQRAWAYLKAKPAQLGLADKEVTSLTHYVQNNMHDTRIRRELERVEGRLTFLRRMSN